MSLVTTSYSSITDTTALTITLASLATSASSVAGRNSTIVDNTSNKYVDFLVSGQITTGTTPTTAKTISIYVYSPIKVVTSTSSYPIATATALTETDAAATFEVDQRNALKLAASMGINATSDRAYSFSFSIAQLFGGVAPLKWGIWVTHDTAVNLNATAGNHWAHYTGIKYDIT